MAPEAAQRANAWSDIFVPPVTPERFATWVMRNDKRDMIMMRNLLSANGTVLVPETDDPTAEEMLKVNFYEFNVVESNSPGVEAAEMFWSCDVVIKGAMDDGSYSTQRYLVRVLLQSGTLYLAFANGPLVNFDPDYRGFFNEAYFNKSLNSLRISPYVEG